MNNCNGFEIYNLGNSDPVSVNNLVAEIEEAIGKKAIKKHLPMQPGDVDITYADIAKAAKHLGYNPGTQLKAGLKKFADWLTYNQS